MLLTIDTKNLLQNFILSINTIKNESGKFFKINFSIPIHIRFLYNFINLRTIYGPKENSQFIRCNFPITIYIDFLKGFSNFTAIQALSSIGSRCNKLGIRYGFHIIHSKCLNDILKTDLFCISLYSALLNFI